MAKTDIKDMSVFQKARWYSLLDAVNIISNECERRDKNFDKMKISPLVVQKYIESTCDIYARKIEADVDDTMDVSNIEELTESETTIKPISPQLAELGTEIKIEESAE